VETLSKGLPTRLYEEPLRAHQEYESVATAIGEVRSSLQGTFHGDLLGPADPAHANARVIWNGMVARSPAQTCGRAIRKRKQLYPLLETTEDSALRVPRIQARK
jgi:hypothetical protein